MTTMPPLNSFPEAVKTYVRGKKTGAVLLFLLLGFPFCDVMF